MEDSIEVILQDRSSKFMHRCQDNRILTLSTWAVFTGFYGLWTMFMLPGFLKVPFRLKVPYMPSSTAQTQNVMKLLEGRKGRLADLGSGDGRLVFAACSLGFQCTGFEINSMLRAYSRGKARWKGIPYAHVNFVNKDFWKTDLSAYNNVTVFLAPSVMEVLEEKLLRELPQEARVVVCRFPFPRWPHTCSAGAGLDQVWAYDVDTVRRPTAQSLQM
ncbi:adenine nucleotide translocase lysine N-methyltransferase-like [Megalops cyprinoides]|uniref:adenine nucleotide translocase lysine N-methyltransferase-like n=1 Tax=Megalops cyprinoides TaxID=118141 RepID=UPI001863F729|nr:adenine nucleotide translocase lysine N-methyltransferase-like [Megalops cyprinoides]XP_036384922.1 adenine nucleotide translocase lysine N-methyltransferase-like [Megalops cyprinoides]XP_036384923.1 adenine nucleotide translocase lysine N-methyltransferase-like [Megalops cyprinoides]